MNGLDEIEVLAGEYVLGTLDAAERAEVDERRQHDFALDRAIRRWERQLSPLLEVGEPITPPADLFSLIERRLDQPANNRREPAGNVVALRRRVNLWRSVAAVSTALAASLLFVIVWKGIMQRTPETRLVAVLQKDSTSPAFVVSVDLPARTLTVKTLTGPPAPDKSYELWLVNANLGEPRSLGVIAAAPFTVSQRLRSYDPDIIKNSAIAISLEPKGGSPTGKVTGPVLYSAPLINTAL